MSEQDSAKLRELEASMVANGWSIVRPDGTVDFDGPAQQRMERLMQLARDIADNFHCNCFTDDLESDDCPCGGDGRVNADGDAGAIEGCWRCQALAALAPLAESEPAPARGEDRS